MCQCGANCEDRRLPPWLVAQLNDARSGFLAVSGVKTDGFCCPLCIRVLPQTCATVAHSPSKEAGGDGQTFLCKACNSYLGTAYEAGAAGMLSRIREARATGGSTHKIALAHRGGARIYTEAVLSGDGAKHRVEATSRRKATAAEKRFAKEAQGGAPLTMSFQAPGEENIKLAFLSWAYLLLSRRLGYVFVFGESGRMARRALLSGSVKSLSPAFFVIRGQLDGVVEPVVSGLLIRRHAGMNSPVAVACEIGNAFVALPLAEDPVGRYEHLVDYTTDGSQLIVLPFDVVYGPESALPGIADYWWQSITVYVIASSGPLNHKPAQAWTTPSRHRRVDRRWVQYRQTGPGRHRPFPFLPSPAAYRGERRRRSTWRPEKSR